MMKNIDNKVRLELGKQFPNSTPPVSDRPYLFNRTSTAVPGTSVPSNDDDWVFTTHIAKDRFNFLRLDINNVISTISVGIDPVNNPAAAITMGATTYSGLNNISNMINNQQHYCKIAIELFYVGRRLDNSLTCMPRLKCLYIDTAPSYTM